MRRTSKASGNENLNESTEAAHERRAGDVPILSTNVLMCGIGTSIDANAKNYEYDNSCHLQRRYPVLWTSVGKLSRLIGERMITHLALRMFLHEQH